MNINTDDRIVSIDKIQPNKYNPKVDSLEIIETVKRSITLYGQIDPLKVREINGGYFEIIDGFHRYIALKELGYTEVQIKNLGKVEFMDAVSQLLYYNEHNPVDQVELGKLFDQLQKEHGQTIESIAEKVPQRQEEIKALVESVTNNFAEYEKQVARKSPVYKLTVTFSDFEVENFQSVVSTIEEYSQKNQISESEALYRLINQNNGNTTREQPEQ